MKRNQRRWVPLVMILAGLSFGVGAATYNSVDELPAPDLVISDPSGDATSWSGDSVPRNWYDLTEVQGFITDDGIAFAVFCNGNIPTYGGGILFVAIDVDGRGGSFGRGGVTNTRLFGNGYDYGLALQGLVLIRPTVVDVRFNSHLESWRDGRVAYLEIPWDQIGGRPESVAVHVFSLGIGLNSYPAWDLAPNHRGAVLEIPVAAPM